MENYVFLTGARGENTGNVGAKRLLGLGIKYQTSRGFYPLVISEMQYISREVLVEPHREIRFGHSVLYRGKKYISPVVEYRYPAAGEGAGPGTAARRRMQALTRAIGAAERARPILEKVGGKVLLQTDEGRNAHILLLLMPSESIAKIFPNFSAWKRFVRASIGEDGVLVTAKKKARVA